MSNQPDDRSMTGRQPTEPMGMGTAQRDTPVAGPHDDPAGWGSDPGDVPAPAPGSQGHDTHVDVRDHAPSAPSAPPQDLHGRADRADQGSAMDDAVHSLSQPDNRAKLLMAIAVMVALTLLITLGLLIDRLVSDDTAEPVLVDGVPCLVEAGPDNTAILYCQR